MARPRENERGLGAGGCRVSVYGNSVVSGLVSFTLPLVLSKVLRLVFGTISVVIIKRFAKGRTLTTIKSAATLVGIFAGLFVKVSLKTGILTTHFFTSNERGRVSSAMRATVLLTLVDKVLVTKVKMVDTGNTLLLVKAPSGIVTRSALCVQVCFLKVPFFVLCGCKTTVLHTIKSAGQPLLFLIVSKYTGTLLSLVLIVNFRLKITNMTATAVATRVVSYVLILLYLCHASDYCRLHFSGLGVGGICLLRVFRIKVPTKVRDAIVGFSGTLLRSSIGSFKSATVTKCATTGGVLKFLCVSMGSVARTYVDFADRGCNIKGCGHVSHILVSYLVLAIDIPLLLKYNT